MDRRLRHHLATWLGQWPTTRPLQVVGSHRRTIPGWDDHIHPAIGVACPLGEVLSVPPETTADVRKLASQGPEALHDGLPAAVGYPHLQLARAVFRWCEHPAPLPPIGHWVGADEPGVPAWLRVFGGDVLISRDPDTGAYLAGVGIKRHSSDGREISVGTAEEARGRGLARALVAQAAQRILDEGAIPTYLHDPANTASARVADAAGFPDEGWTCRFLVPPPA